MKLSFTIDSSINQFLALMWQHFFIQLSTNFSYFFEFFVDFKDLQSFEVVS